MSAIVLGGGPAGAAAACLLARAGRAVRLIERHATPTHKLCGEFLSCEAQTYLARLGIDPAALGAEPISHLRLVQGSREIETKLPFRGYGLTRKRLDEALLQEAAGAGAELLRGHAVTRVVAESGGIALEIDGLGREICDTLFLASGKHAVRGLPRAADDDAADWLGFKTYFRLPPASRRALHNSIELVWFRDGYAGLQLVEGGLANLCLLVRRSGFLRAGASWDGFLTALLARSPHLGRRLEGAEPVLDRPLAVTRLPYGTVHRATDADPPGLFRLGDQAGLIEPFVGDGISLALHSAHLAVAAHLAREDAAAYHRRLARDIGRPIGRARLLALLARNAVARSALLACPPLLRGLASWTRLASAP